VQQLGTPYAKDEKKRALFSTA